MAFRSTRLNSIFGALPESVTYEQLEALTNNDAAGEAEDLDYKLRYDTGDKGSDDIAIDIATFANHLGGVIIVGMAEVNARPSKSVGVELTDEFKRRIRTCVAGRVFPQPQFDIREVRDPADTSKTPRGLLLIMVPRSPLAPHAVMDPKEKEKLRWPRRHGTGKIWLSESEIAATYRRRFVAAVERSERLATVEAENLEAIEGLDEPVHPYTAGLLLVSLVPDVPGDMLIDSESYTTFTRELHTQSVLVGTNNIGELSRAGVGRRRLICSTHGPPLCRIELHTDGSGSFAVQLSGNLGPDGAARIWDASVVTWTASGLRYLAGHARDRTGASGTVAAAITLKSYTQVSNGSPVLGGNAIIWTAGSFGSDVYGPVRQRSATGQADFLLDHLADDGQPLAQATAALVSDLFQSFNAVGTRQITPNGELRPLAWDSDRALAEAWAQDAGIPIADS
ncbi:helix-turn-helix domain-containing protein [Actinomadura viridis]|uniref:AlbA family DNA-binding domain-containing protein n=1 Tax=Actinomadura viridis TaxID=58110 RepID=UPI0036AB828E